MGTYRRSTGIRILSVGCLVLFSLLQVTHLSSGGELLTFGGLLLSGLIALSLFATLLNFGDRYRIDERGIHYANPVLSRLGLSIDRVVVWQDIVSVRAYRALRFGTREDSPSALFLEVQGARRFVIDSVEAFDEIHRLILQRVPGDSGKGGAA